MDCVGPVMDWQTVQNVPHLSPNVSCDRLQPLCDPELDKEEMENGWMESGAVILKAVSTSSDLNHGM